MITLTCLGCGSSFTVAMPYQAKNRRFCTRECFYKWNSGPKNNPQWTQVLLHCGHCGKPFYRKPALIHEGMPHYCCPECGHAEHGAKIAGPKHGNWRGGAVHGRGTKWPAIREIVLSRQGRKCFDCDMPEEAHKARYGCSLHVHHASPYRLTLDNSPDKLIALCIPCHGRENAATHRSLSPEDYAQMRANTKVGLANGSFADDYARQYNTCPLCGGRKAKHAKRCTKCRHAARTWDLCPVCGQHTKTSSTFQMCKACRLKVRRKEIVWPPAQ